jgi:hypothetical protein
MTSAQDNGTSESNSNSEGTNESEEVQKLQEEIKILKLEVEKKAQEEKLADEGLPEPTATALTGKLTVDEKVLIESQITLFTALDEMAGTIADRINNSTKMSSLKGNTIIILSDTDAAALFLAQVMTERFSLLQSGYAEFKKNVEEFDETKQIRTLSIAGAAVAATATARALADFVALFREDAEFKGRETTVAPEAVAIRVASELTKMNYSVRLLSTIPGIGVGSAGLSTPLDSELKPLAAERMAAKQALVEFKTKGFVQQENDAAENDGSGNKEPTGKTAKADPWEAHFDSLMDSLDEDYDQLMGTLNSVDTKTKISGAGIFLRGLLIRSILDSGDPTILRLRVEAAGGAYVLRKSLWRGSWLESNGGIVVSFSATSVNGEILAAGGAHGFGQRKNHQAQKPNA